MRELKFMVHAWIWILIFKVWVGITSALFDYAPDDDGIITLPFSEFADRCGYPRKRLSKAFRKKY